VGQLCPRSFHARFLRIDLRLRSSIGLQSVVEILLCDGFLLGQRLVLFHVKLGFNLIRLCLGQTRLGLQ
jgi:hypothetical protein